ncbi:MAG: hypothetical protein DMG77_03445 [Acidobacteria bacterium]|nr:MAG: hypothetical protein DMG77_03445 [Acidobacteriota bacterium]
MDRSPGGESATSTAAEDPNSKSARARSRWIAISIVGFWWALQHSFLPLILDWKYVAWRFLAFLPGVVVFMLSYLKLRRLLPLIVAHWPMDILAILITLKF